VSTILEALREREPKLTPAGGGPIHRADLRDWSPWRWALIAGLAVAAASLPLVLGGRDAIGPHRPEPRSDLPRPVPVPERSGRSATVPKMPGDGEPPRARVERWRPSTSPSVAAAPPAVAAAPTAAPPPAVAAPAPEGAAPPATQGPSAGSQTEPAVRLRSIGYVTAPEKRTATLTVDGAPAVTLRQGESAGGIEVQLILRESVYVRHGPDVFAVGVER
jgi:hypothetical protein